MAPVIGGHGGEFRLREPNSTVLDPRLEFTLPSPSTQIRLNDGDPMPPLLIERVFLRPQGVPEDIMHPNNHPTHKHAVPLPAPTSQSPFDEIRGSLEPDDGDQKPREFVVRYYRDEADNQTIQIPSEASGGTPAVTFKFKGEAGFYMVVVVYNFHALESSVPGYLPIKLQTEVGLKDEADRSCYVYIVAAKDAENLWDPQLLGHAKKVWPGASLELNVYELGQRMYEESNLNVGEGETLYVAPAQQIDESNLTYTERVIVLDKITDQSTVTPTGVIFKVDSTTLPASMPDFPMGLYVVASPTSFVAQADVPAI